MNRVKIAFFLDVMEEDFDGVANTMHQVIKRIPNDLLEPIFITPQPPKKDFPYPVYTCPYWSMPFNQKDYRFALPGKMKSLKRTLDQFGPDIIHFSSPSAMGSYAVKYARANKLPVTTIYHTHFPSFATYYLRFIPWIEQLSDPIIKRLFWVYRAVDRVLAPTPTMRDYLLGKGVKEEAINIWGRGVSTDRFGPHHRDENLWPSLSPTTKKVIFVSRLVKEKEPKTLIRLYQLLAKRRPDIKMIVTGDGPTKRILEESMPDAIFTGKLTGEDLARAYASSDVFVFPSVTETFGNVVLEALASGLPVVAANGGGPVDIIKQGVTGVLVEHQNEEAFYEEIVKLLDNEEYYATSRQNAFQLET